jgi:hypothetical protein
MDTNNTQEINKTNERGVRLSRQSTAPSFCLDAL